MPLSDGIVDVNNTQAVQEETMVLNKEPEYFKCEFIREIIKGSRTKKIVVKDDYVTMGEETIYMKVSLKKGKNGDPFTFYLHYIKDGKISRSEVLPAQFNAEKEGRALVVIGEKHISNNDIKNCHNNGEFSFIFEVRHDSNDPLIEIDDVVREPMTDKNNYSKNPLFMGNFIEMKWIENAIGQQSVLPDGCGFDPINTGVKLIGGSLNESATTLNVTSMELNNGPPRDKLLTTIFTGDIIRIGHEVMRVKNRPNATQLEVERDFMGALRPKFGNLFGFPAQTHSFEPIFKIMHPTLLYGIIDVETQGIPDGTPIKIYLYRHDKDFVTDTNRKRHYDILPNKGNINTRSSIEIEKLKVEITNVNEMKGRIVVDGPATLEDKAIKYCPKLKFPRYFIWDRCPECRNSNKHECQHPYLYFGVEVGKGNLTRSIEQHSSRTENDCLKINRSILIVNDPGRNLPIRKRETDDAGNIIRPGTAEFLNIIRNGGHVYIDLLGYDAPPAPAPPAPPPPPPGFPPDQVTSNQFLDQIARKFNRYIGIFSDHGTVEPTPCDTCDRRGKKNTEDITFTPTNANSFQVNETVKSGVAEGEVKAVHGNSIDVQYVQKAHFAVDGVITGSLSGATGKITVVIINKGCDGIEGQLDELRCTTYGNYGYEYWLRWDPSRREWIDGSNRWKHLFRYPGKYRADGSNGNQPTTGGPHKAKFCFRDGGRIEASDILGFADNQYTPRHLMFVDGCLCSRDHSLGTAFSKHKTKYFIGYKNVVDTNDSSNFLQDLLDRIYKKSDGLPNMKIRQEFNNWIKKSTFEPKYIRMQPSVYQNGKFLGRKFEYNGNFRQRRRQEGKGPYKKKADLPSPGPINKPYIP